MKFSELSGDKTPTIPIETPKPKPIFHGHILQHPMVKLLIDKLDCKVIRTYTTKAKPIPSTNPPLPVNIKNSVDIIFNNIQQLYPCPFSKLISKGKLTPLQNYNIVLNNFKPSF